MPTNSLFQVLKIIITRGMARFFDLFVISIFTGTIIVILNPSMFEINTQHYSDLTFSLALLFYLFYDTFSTWKFQTTAGKYLLGMKISRINNRDLSFLFCGARTFAVIAFTSGFFIPNAYLLTFLATIVSLSFGNTPWDKLLGTEVTYTKVTLRNIFIYISSLIGSIAIMVSSIIFLQKRTPSPNTVRSATPESSSGSACGTLTSVTTVAFATSCQSQAVALRDGTGNVGCTEYVS